MPPISAPLGSPTIQAAYAQAQGPLIRGDTPEAGRGVAGGGVGAIAGSRAGADGAEGRGDEGSASVVVDLSAEARARLLEDRRLRAEEETAARSA